jgi:hypothetical protein
MWDKIAASADELLANIAVVEGLAAKAAEEARRLSRMQQAASQEGRRFDWG